MEPSRHATLPQLSGRPMVTDGGLETDLIFRHGVDLPGGNRGPRHLLQWGMRRVPVGARPRPGNLRQQE